MLTVPAIVEASTEPRAAAQVWASIFRRGAYWGPRVSFCIFLGLGYSAYDRAQRGGSWAPYAIGGALTFAVMPFTLGVMMPTNNALLAVAEGKKTLGAADFKGLLQKWQLLNNIRGLLPLVGSAIMLWDVIRQL
jgi:anthrone oxygenase-like protein